MVGDQFREWCEIELDNCRRALELFTEQTVRAHEGKVHTTPTLIDHIRRQINELERMLPERVSVRIEGTYADGEPFVAKLAVTPDGIHTAHRTNTLGTERQVLKQRHKLDVRLEPRTTALRCPRYCRKPGQ